MRSEWHVEWLKPKLVQALVPFFPGLFVDIMPARSKPNLILNEEKESKRNLTQRFIGKCYTLLSSRENSILFSSEARSRHR